MTKKKPQDIEKAAEALAKTDLAKEREKALKKLDAASQAYQIATTQQAGETFIAGQDSADDEKLAEHVINETCAWKGRFFDISRLEVELPDGRHALRDVMRHPGAVGVIALSDDGKICLVRQYRTALDRVTVEIPAGKLDPGEDPQDAALRELKEETGVIAHKIAHISSIAPSVGCSDEMVHLYMATELEMDEQALDDDEFIHVDFVELTSFVDAVLDGQVEDAKTVVAALICDAISRRLTPEDN